MSLIHNFLHISSSTVLVVAKLGFSKLTMDGLMDFCSRNFQVLKLKVTKLQDSTYSFFFFFFKFDLLSSAFH